MIDRASLLTSDREKNTIKLSLNGNELMISSNSPEIGKSRGKKLVLFLIKKLIFHLVLHLC
ncbi:MAG: hypothetical protein L6V91_01350 [Bacilli bacterium]|nr:MAG: hypothetical protein L6V91_01350 [Bacilli bacterium]